MAPVADNLMFGLEKRRKRSMSRKRRDVWNKGRRRWWKIWHQIWKRRKMKLMPYLLSEKAIEEHEDRWVIFLIFIWTGGRGRMRNYVIMFGYVWLRFVLFWWHHVVFNFKFKYYIVTDISIVIILWLQYSDWHCWKSHWCYCKRCSMHVGTVFVGYKNIPSLS